MAAEKCGYPKLATLTRNALIGDVTLWHATKPVLKRLWFPHSVRMAQTELSNQWIARWASEPFRHATSQVWRLHAQVEGGSPDASAFLVTDPAKFL